MLDNCRGDRQGRLALREVSNTVKNYTLITPLCPHLSPTRCVRGARRRFVDFRNTLTNGMSHPEADGTSFTFLDRGIQGVGAELNRHVSLQS
jgi:hypothetical protein